MIQISPNSTPQWIRIRNILSTTIRLYRSQFSRFILIALRACAWPIATILVSTIVLGGIIALIAAPLEEPTPLLGFAIFISVIVWSGCYLYGFAKFIANSALISKQAFDRLTDSTESPKQACEGIKSKTWAFLRIAIYLGILYSLSFLSVVTLGGFVFVIPIGILSGMDIDRSVWISIAILGVLYVIASFGLFLWLFARWFVAEVVLAIEDNGEAGESISRSWILTGKYPSKVILIAGIGLLITSPIQIVQLVVSFLPEIAVVVFEINAYGYFTLLILSTLLCILIGSAILPFWQVMKALLYRDLKVREEAIVLDT